MGARPCVGVNACVGKQREKKKKRESGGGGGSRGQQDSSMRLFTSCTHIDAHWAAHTYTAHTHTHKRGVRMEGKDKRACALNDSTVLAERVISTSVDSTARTWIYMYFLFFFYLLIFLFVVVCCGETLSFSWKSSCRKARETGQASCRVGSHCVRGKEKRGKRGRLCNSRIPLLPSCKRRERKTQQGKKEAPAATATRTRSP